MDDLESPLYKSSNVMMIIITIGAYTNDYIHCNNKMSQRINLSDQLLR